MKKITLLPLLASLTLGATAFAHAPNDKDIVDIAAGNKDFSTLVSLVKKAGLVDVLKGDGPFTVLAPTDKAFAKLPKPLVEKVVNSPELLKAVLTYHVIPGKVLSTDLKNGLKAKTVQGENVSVLIAGKKVAFNNNANVVAADIAAKNGVIHVIDTVILPPSIAKAAAAK